MKSSILLLGILIISFQNAYNQIVPQIVWQRSFGGTEEDISRVVIPTADGGYFIAGDSESDSSGNKWENVFGWNDYWVIKLNSAGVIEWQNNIDAGASDNLYAAVQTDDGGFLLAGNTASLPSGDKTEPSKGGVDLWIIKLNPEGSIVWQKVIGGSLSDYMTDLVKTADGGFLIASRSSSNVSGDKTEASVGGSYDFWVLKINSIGNIVWQNTIGGSSTDYTSCIVETPDGGCIVGGYTSSGISGEKTEAAVGGPDYWIIRLNSTGSIVWQNTIGGTSEDQLEHIVALPGDEYVLGGFSSSHIGGDKTENASQEDVWIVKISGTGSIIWQNTITGNIVDYLYAFATTSDGGFILGASSNSDIGYDKTENHAVYSDYWIIKLNSSGAKVWDNNIGANQIDNITSINQAADGSFIIGGYTPSIINYDKTTPNYGSYDYWIIKLEKEGAMHTYYPDVDGDGYGNLLAPVTGLTPPPGYILDNSDCNDANAMIFPESAEICNSMDDDCDGTNDDGILFTTYYFDADADAFGNSLLPTSACSGPPAGYTLHNGDCNEANSEINPGAPEVVNMLDDNCDGLIETSSDFIWQNVIGGGSYDHLYSMDETPDGGYILGGYSNSDVGFDKSVSAHISTHDYWVVKVNSDGIIEWDKTIVSNANDYLTSVIACSDGGYLVSGNTDGDLGFDKSEENIGQNDLWILKLDHNGNIEWQNTIGGTWDDEVWKVEQTADGGFLVGANSISALNGDKTEAKIGYTDLWFLKLNSTGNILWQNVVGGTGGDYGNDFVLLPDGSFVVAASSNSNIGGDKTENAMGGVGNDLWIIKFNPAGSIVWQNTITGGSEDDCAGIDASSDGGFIVGATSHSNNFGSDKTEPSNGGDDFWILKLNSTGSIVWQHSFGGSLNEILTDVETLDDGTVLISGYSESPLNFDKTEINFGEYDWWLLQLDASGDEIYQNTIGGSADDFLYDLIESSDGNIVCGGYSSSPAAGDKAEASLGFADFWIYKLNIAPDLCILTATVTPSGVAFYCAGGTVTLSAPYDPDYLYQWKWNGSNMGGATTSTINPFVNGYYSVLINDGECTDESDPVHVTKSTPPTATINNLDPTNDICFDPSIKLKSNSGPGYTWQWYKGPTALAGATNQVYFATSSGNYKVKVTNAAGCSKNSSPYSIIQTCKTSTENIGELSIYPNPNNGNFFVDPGNQLSEEKMNVSIKNLLGQTIYTIDVILNGDVVNIQMDFTPSPAFYIVEINSPSMHFSEILFIGN